MITANDIKRLRQIRDKNFRDTEGLFAVEGDRAICEIRSAGLEPLEYYSIADGSITRQQLERISSLKTPGGSFALFRKPFSSMDLPPKDNLSILLDTIQDPGNLGTIIRTADWFGIDHIYASRSTADCFNSKVVQATMGAIARVRVFYTDLHTVIEKSDLPVYGTFMSNAKNIYNCHLPKAALLIMGNEGNGISPDIESLVTDRITIPCGDKPHVESLNVSIATAIAISEFMRQ